MQESKRPPKVMNFDDALEAVVCRAEAQAEIARHDCEGWEAFLRDVGDRDEYLGAEVLAWLGY